MSAHSPLGEIIRGPGPETTLRYSRALRHAPDKVWRALTEPEHTRWWLPIEMIGPLEPDATVALRFWPDLADRHGIDRDAGSGTIRIWEPSTTFEWTWAGSIVRFDVSPTAHGSELTLTVTVTADDIDTIIDNAAGYHLWMDHITELLGNGAARPIAAADAQPVEARYRARLQRE